MKPVFKNRDISIDRIETLCELREYSSGTSWCTKKDPHSHRYWMGGKMFAVRIRKPDEKDEWRKALLFIRNDGDTEFQFTNSSTPSPNRDYRMTSGLLGFFKSQIKPECLREKVLAEMRFICKDIEDKAGINPRAFCVWNLNSWGITITAMTPLLIAKMDSEKKFTTAQKRIVNSLFHPKPSEKDIKEISSHPLLALSYAIGRTGGRFEAGEPAIVKNAKCLEKYTEHLNSKGLMKPRVKEEIEKLVSMEIDK